MCVWLCVSVCVRVNVGETCLLFLIVWMTGKEKYYICLNALLFFRTFIDALRRGIESAVDRNNSRGRLDLENLSDNFQDDSAIIHQLAFVPVCK